MAEIPDRLAVEASILRKLEVDARGVRGALRSGREVDWGGVQARMTATLRDELIAIYIVMYLLFLDDDAVRSRLTNAQLPSQDLVALAAAGRIGPRVEAIIGQILDDARRKQIDLGGTIPRSEKTGLDKPRLEGVVITEVTNAGSYGEDEAKEEARRGGVLTDLIWVTERDDRVCMICRPLDGTGEAIWRKVVPNGGAAHPRCRCHKRLEVIL